MSNLKFDTLVPHLKTWLTRYHGVLSGRCKAENWEELCSKALVSAGFGSDWEPDFNHGVGKDQTTGCGIRISNKSGKLNKDCSKMTISGSRLTRHPTLTEKLEFLSKKYEDFIFCLATNDEDWKNGRKVYYFIVIDSNDLNYHEVAWEDTVGVKGKDTGKVVGHKCVGNGFTASIKKSMSHQLWTDIDSSLFKEIHELVI